MALTEFVLIWQVFAEYFRCVCHCHRNVDGIETRTIYESVPGLFGERVPELVREHVSVNSSAFIALVAPRSYSDDSQHRIIKEKYSNKKYRKDVKYSSELNQFSNLNTIFRSNCVHLFTDPCKSSHLIQIKNVTLELGQKYVSFQITGNLLSSVSNYIYKHIQNTSWKYKLRRDELVCHVT